MGAIPSALLVILMFPMPETPRWYLGKNRRSDALCALLWLRGPDADIDKECTTIEETFGKFNLIMDLVRRDSHIKSIGMLFLSTLKVTKKAPAVDLLKLNTLWGKYTAFTPKKFDEKPCPSYKGASPPPGVLDHV